MMIKGHFIISRSILSIIFKLLFFNKGAYDGEVNVWAMAWHMSTTTDPVFLWGTSFNFFLRMLPIVNFICGERSNMNLTLWWALRKFVKLKFKLETNGLVYYSFVG